MWDRPGLASDGSLAGIIALPGFVLVATAQVTNMILARGLAGSVPPFRLAFFVGPSAGQGMAEIRPSSSSTNELEPFEEGRSALQFTLVAKSLQPVEIMHDPGFFDQGGIDADFSKIIRIRSPNAGWRNKSSRGMAQLTGSHRALEEFLGPRFHIRVHRGESAFPGLAR
jgi:hypothetical protein